NRKREADEEYLRDIAEMKDLHPQEEILKKIKEAADLDSNSLDPIENKILKVAEAGNIAEAKKIYLDQYLPLKREQEEVIKQIGDLSIKEKADSLEMVKRNYQSARMTIGVLAFFMLAIGLLLSILISNLIVRPIRKVQSSLRQIATTDLSGLAEQTQAVSSGDFTRDFIIDARRLDISTQNEIGDME